MAGVVLRQPFQGVQATQPDRGLVRAELVDGLGVEVGGPAGLGVGDGRGMGLPGLPQREFGAALPAGGQQQRQAAAEHHHRAVRGLERVQLRLVLAVAEQHQQHHGQPRADHHQRHSRPHHRPGREHRQRRPVRHGGSGSRAPGRRRTGGHGRGWRTHAGHVAPPAPGATPIPSPASLSSRSNAGLAGVGAVSGSGRLIEPHRSLWVGVAGSFGHALHGLTGHLLTGTFTSLRSLFQFAKRERMIFTDPTMGLHVGKAPKPAFLPMSDAEIRAVKAVATRPEQRLVIASAAVYAARAKAIRELRIDDIDLAARRITIGGKQHRLIDFVHRTLVDWLRYRRQRWPHPGNPHLLVSKNTALASGPVDDYYLNWHLSHHGVQLEQIRADRILREALAVNADPLHVRTVFNLSTTTAIDYTDIDYTDIARSMLERPIEISDALS